MKTGSRLRIVYIVPDLGIGGAERHVTTLMTRIDRSRFDPSVICIGKPGELFSSLDAAGVPAVALGRTRRQAPWALCDLVRELRRQRPEIVIVRGYNAEVLGRLAAAVAGVPRVIVWVHNCGDLEPRGALRKHADRVLDRVTDAYFGVAEAQVPYMTNELGYARPKIRIIHNGVDVTTYETAHPTKVRTELGLSDEDLVVGIIAALRPEKDHRTFLRAAQLLVPAFPTARFVIVGGGPERESLEELTQQLGIADKVIFAGPRSDVPDVLRAVDVVVLTSYTIECFPMALLEAMASSRPAVCTEVGGVAEMLENGVTGFLVPPKDPRELARRLGDLLRSPELRIELGRAARARVMQEFSLERSVRKTERHLLETTAAGSARTQRPIRLTVVMDETSIGGVELLTLNLFQSFDRLVVEPRLICLRRPGPLVREFAATGAEVEVMDRRGRFDVRTLPRLVRSLRRGRTDAVLVAHHHRASLALGRLAAKLARVQVDLVAAHDMDLTSVGKRCLPTWAVATLGASSALILLSARQGEYLRSEEGVGRHRWSRTTEVVIPNGIPLPPLPTASEKQAARDALGLTSEDFVVGIVARLSEQKAHQVLLAAIAELAIEHPESRLVIVGGGPRENELLRLVRQLGLEDRVLFLGICRDVTAVLPAFDVSCLSSVHEGVPIVLIESMAAGLPVVATDCGSISDMVADGEQGFVVSVGDSSAMARRLAVLAEDRDVRLRMGTSARRRAEEAFRIERTTHDYERLLVELVRER